MIQRCDSCVELQCLCVKPLIDGLAGAAEDLDQRLMMTGLRLVARLFPGSRSSLSALMLMQFEVAAGAAGAGLTGGCWRQMHNSYQLFPSTSLSWQLFHHVQEVNK